MLLANDFARSYIEDLIVRVMQLIIVRQPCLSFSFSLTTSRNAT